MTPAGSAERDLLLGILALQNGLVDQSDLIAAFQAWSRDRARPLARVLVDREAMAESDRLLLEDLASRHLQKHGGDPERSLAALGAPATIVEGLRRAGVPAIEATLARIAAGGDGATVADPQATVTWGVGPPEADISRFRILRPHAKGGIGVVSVALDAELNREVALKQIQPEQADDPTSRARFLLEAEVTGRLEHPGVVPVYSLGRDAEGRPYYAMRFVRGDSLKEAIAACHAADVDAGRGPAERATALGRLLRRFIGACETVAYAHSRGVIHRDLKPANILLGPYGETLVVDWGLAKVVGRDGEGPTAEATLRPASAGGSGSSETAAGTVIGTPAYMSPEQAEGRLESIGPASDVYSLGATLYCLVTGKPPLQGEVGEVLRWAQRGDIPPARQVNRRAPSALEAVCRRAMAPKPHDRYPSARALGEEVERWLADEPVSAYRDPLSVRLVRWGRRHRTAAVGIGALLVAGVVALAVGAALIGREQARTEAKAEELRRQGYVDRVNRALRETEAGNVALSESLIGECPADLRGWEWDYVVRLGHRDRLTYLGHAPPRSVLCLAASPDGTWIASGAGTAYDSARSDEAAEIRLWDVVTGRDRRLPLGGMPGTVRCLAISPDGTLLAAGGGFYHPEVRGWLTLWDLATGRPLWTNEVDGMTVLSVAFAPDGRSLATGSGIPNSPLPGRWDMRDVATGAGLRGDRVRLGPVSSLAFLPQRPQLALACRDRVELWDWEAGIIVQEFPGHAGTVFGVAVSRDGARIASGGWDNTVRIVDLADATIARTIFGHEGFVEAVAFCPDGTELASASHDGSVRLSEAATGRPLASFFGHPGPVFAVTCDPRGRWIASGGEAGEVKVWDLRRSRPVVFRGQSDWVTGVAFRRDGRRVASEWERRRVLVQEDAKSGDIDTKSWDPDTGEEDPASAGMTSGLGSGYGPFVRFGELNVASPDGRRTARPGGPNDIRVTDSATGRTYPLVGHTQEVTCVVFSPDGSRIATTSWDRTIKLWDAANGRELLTLRGHTAGVICAAFSPDGRRLVSGSNDKTARVWDARPLGLGARSSSPAGDRRAESPGAR